MRSTTPSPATDPEDLTPRARLREAAIVRFARDGFAVGLRAIAADAGLSAASVIKHFGSKDGLRAACDAHVFALIRRTKREAIVDSPDSTAVLRQLAGVEAYAPAVAYVLRSLKEGGPHAQAFIEHMIDDAVAYTSDAVAAGTVVPTRDERARCRYLLMSSLGGMLLDLALDPVAEPADLGPWFERHVGRVMLPALEVFTEGLLADRRMLDDYLAYVGDPPGSDDPAHAPPHQEEHPP